MTTTANYGLKKPAATDNYNIADQNDNMDLIDAQMKDNADAAGGAISKNVATTSDQTLVSTASAAWTAKTLSEFKSWLALTASSISDFVTTVRSTVLAGLSTATNSAITAADTVLTAFGKLQAQITANLSTLTTHTSNTSNPHATTAAQIGAVAKTGDETVAGVKTFSSFPVTPSSAPTTNYQAANKKYADDQTAARTPLRATLTTLTASATLALTHAGQRLKINSSSAVTITVPPNASVAFTIGDEIELLAYGTGTVTIAADSGVSVLSKESSLIMDGQYAIASLVKIGTDEWVLAGALI